MSREPLCSCCRPLKHHFQAFRISSPPDTSQSQDQRSLQSDEVVNIAEKDTGPLSKPGFPMNQLCELRPVT